jgi:hypothetical protein
MSIRYLSNLVLALVAGFLVVAKQAFSLGAVKWLTFAIAIGATVLSLGTAGFRVGLVQRAISAVAAVIGIWTIVESLVFSLHTVMWLGFASALALVGLAVVGLTVHEFSTERVVHSLEIEQEAPTRRRDPLAA